ncbi:MAG: HEAT repeat domain-containing protein [Bacteroides sp.]|jgi:hypothetical protein|nr:HEAT repeat domain-containing protein [Bacteroides sp.]
MKKRNTMTTGIRTIKVFFSILVFLSVTGLFLEAQATAYAQTPGNDSNDTVQIDESPAPAETANDSLGKITELSTKDLWEWFVNRYRQASLKVKILVVIVIYLIISLILLFTFIIVNRTIKTRERRQAKEIREIYQEELTNFLFGEDNQTFEFTGIHHEGNREIFINELLSLHNNLYGEAANRLRDLYFNLELYKDSMRKVNSGRWNIKAKGFSELAQMDVKDANRNIANYINSKNKILRIESQVALVKLNEEDPLGFLDELKYELTEWEQINILNTLNYHQIKIDSFDRWMNSENDSVVIFVTKLAGLNKQLQSWPKVLELLEHQNPKVRKAAIKTLDMFEVSENAGLLKEVYIKDQPQEEKEGDVFYNLNMDHNRKAVIEALGTIATSDDLPFLEQVLRTDKDFDILKKTVAIVRELKPGGMELLDKILVNADEDLRKIIENAKQTAVQ